MTKGGTKIYQSKLEDIIEEDINPHSSTHIDSAKYDRNIDIIIQNEEECLSSFGHRSMITNCELGFFR